MNKNKILSLIGISVLALSACGIDNTGNEAQQTSSAKLVESESSQESSKEVDEMLVTNGEILEVGQYSISDPYGKVELEKISNPGNRVEVAPGVFVTFGAVKVINFADIPESAQEDANYYYGFTGSQGYDLQFEYTVENTNDYKIDNAVVDQVVLSDGEQLDRSIYGDEAFELEAGSKASNQVGHITLPHSDIDSVKFYINPVSYDTYEPLGSQPVEVTFE